MLQHRHLILTGEVDEPPIDEDALKSFLLRLVDSLGMKKLCDPVAVYCDEPGNVGMTGFVLLTTSHASYHDWEKEDGSATVQLDIYTCGDLVPEAVVEFLMNNLNLTKFTYRVFDREYELEQVASGSFM